MNRKETNLLPAGIKKQMWMIRWVAIYTVIGSLILLLILGLIGVFHNLMTCAVVTAVLLFVTTPLLIPGLMFNKVSQSTVRFTDNRLEIYYNTSVCWRSIEYSAITTIRVEEISGFFYGCNKEMYRNRYICIFLNGLTSIPDVAFAKLFSERDFLMFAYDAEALHLLHQYCTIEKCVLDPE